MVGSGDGLGVGVLGCWGVGVLGCWGVGCWVGCCVGCWVVGLDVGWLGSFYILLFSFKLFSFFQCFGRAKKKTKT